MRLVRQLGLAGLLLLAVTVVAFALTDLLPGDPAVAILGDQATPQAVKELHISLGLDRPIYQRYFIWLEKAASGDLGHSYRTNESVSTLIAQRLPVTLELLILTQVFALLLALPLGILSAYRRGSAVDRAIGQLCMTLLSMPPYLVGILLIYGIAVSAGLLPASGYVDMGEGVGGNLRTMFLPTATLALSEFPIYLRLLRTDLIQTLQQDFVMVARAKGLRPTAILFRHALKPSSFSLITVIGVNVGRLIGGTVVIETLFALPGIGQLLVSAVYQHDQFTMQGIILTIATAFIFINLGIDALYALLDPRVLHAGGEK
ncbi:ABC transporter permease [Noviherbaspirillum pedocola]|uniref:ABC transporter permease n=1 Tax=Noviherbaspirillum pedocola TaxID=2801341 RepID=A0A934W914_9BURK|nr:ABC transporter permease [Noviherbaspirillum pedocola]MBK4739317.1 ABC transporter permease [Noviherbaspirillum pedocola]